MGKAVYQDVIMCNDAVIAVIPISTSDEGRKQIMNRLWEEDRAKYIKMHGDTLETSLRYKTTYNWRVVRTPVVSDAKLHLIQRIEIQFPEPVEISSQWERHLYELVGEVCTHWEVHNPGNVMWLSGMGQKPLLNWLAVSEDNPQQYDESTLVLEITCREDYKVTEAPTILVIKAKLSTVCSAKGEEFEAIVDLIHQAYEVGYRDGRQSEKIIQVKTDLRPANSASRANSLAWIMYMQANGLQEVIIPSKVVRDIDYLAVLRTHTNIDGDFVMQVHTLKNSED